MNEPLVTDVKSSRTETIFISEELFQSKFQWIWTFEHALVLTISIYSIEKSEIQALIVKLKSHGK